MTRRNKNKQLGGGVPQRPTQPGHSTLILEQKAEVRTGPIPDPETLQRYEHLKPGMIDWILARADAEAEHRRQQERDQTQMERDGRTSEQSAVWRGQVFAFCIAGAAIGSSCVAAMYDHGTAAGVLGGSTVLGLVTAFLGGRWTGPKEGQGDKRR